MTTENENTPNFSDFGDDFDDIFEPQLWLEENEPVELRVASVRTGVAASTGKPWLLVNFVINGEVGYEDISEFFSKPSDAQNSRLKNLNRKQRLSFSEAFSFNWNELEDPQQLVGLVGFAKLGVKLDKRDNVNINFVKEFVAG